MDGSFFLFEKNIYIYAVKQKKRHVICVCAIMKQYIFYAGEKRE